MKNEQDVKCLQVALVQFNNFLGEIMCVSLWWIIILADQNKKGKNNNLKLVFCYLNYINVVYPDTVFWSNQPILDVSLLSFLLWKVQKKGRI